MLDSKPHPRVAVLNLGRRRSLAAYLVILAAVAGHGLMAARAVASDFKSTLWTAATFASHGVRGFNGPGDVSPASMSDMAATGANVVRVFVNLNLNAGKTAYSAAAADLTSLTSVVQSGAKFGFKVIIVFQPNTKLSTPEYWANAGLQASIAANWATLAREYSGNTVIAAYDLINEPVAPSGQSQWIKFATQLIDTLRADDPDHVIIFEPSPGAIPESFLTMTAKLPFANIVYSLHDYEPYGLTMQGISSPLSVVYPSSSPIGPVNARTLSAQLTPVRQFVAKFDVPLYVGEFSCVRWAPPKLSAYDYMANSISLFETEGYSWTYHAWRAYPGWDAELTENFFYQFPYVKAMPQGWQNLDFADYRTSSADAIELLVRYFAGNLH